MENAITEFSAGQVGYYFIGNVWYVWDFINGRSISFVSEDKETLNSVNMY